MKTLRQRMQQLVINDIKECRNQDEIDRLIRKNSGIILDPVLDSYIKIRRGQIIKNQVL